MPYIISFPILAIVIAAYLLVAPGGGMLIDGDAYSMTLASGAEMTLRGGDFFIIAGLIALFLEMLKAARPGRASILDHSLSTATFAVALVALWLIVFGAGLLLLGVPPRGVEVARGLGFLVVAIAYGGVWLAIAMLFSVIFRSTATSALCALGLWLFFFLLWPQLASAIVSGVAPSEIRSLEEYAAVQDIAMALMRLSPGTLFSEAVLGLLSPETRTLGPMLPAQMRGAIMGAPLPFDQSLLLIWPQITGLIAGMIVVFAAAYVVFQREEVRA